MNDRVIWRALPEGAALASSIAIEAARWLKARGEGLWEPEAIGPECFLPFAETGELWLAWREGEAVGTMILQREDPIFWPDVPPGESAFIHKLAVRRAVAGAGVSGALLEAAQRIAREQGRRYLRLDTADRPKLRAVYEAAGFVRRDVRRMESGDRGDRPPVGAYTVVRYELALTE